MSSILQRDVPNPRVVDLGLRCSRTVSHRRLALLATHKNKLWFDEKKLLFYAGTGCCEPQYSGSWKNREMPASRLLSRAHRPLGSQEMNNKVLIKLRPPVICSPGPSDKCQTELAHPDGSASNTVSTCKAPLTQKQKFPRTRAAPHHRMKHHDEVTLVLTVRQSLLCDQTAVNSPCPQGLLLGATLRPWRPERRRWEGAASYRHRTGILPDAAGSCTPRLGVQFLFCLSILRNIFLFPTSQTTKAKDIS